MRTGLSLSYSLLLGIQYPKDNILVPLARYILVSDWHTVLPLLVSPSFPATETLLVYIQSFHALHPQHFFINFATISSHQLWFLVPFIETIHPPPTWYGSDWGTWDKNTEVLHRVNLSKARLADVYPGTDTGCDRCPLSPANTAHAFWSCLQLDSYWATISEALPHSRLNFVFKCKPVWHHCLCIAFGPWENFAGLEIYLSSICCCLAGRLKLEMISFTQIPCLWKSFTWNRNLSCHTLRVLGN